MNSYRSAQDAPAKSTSDSSGLRRRLVAGASQPLLSAVIASLLVAAAGQICFGPCPASATPPTEQTANTTSAVDSSPWQLLAELRQGLEASGPITAKFEHTFVPAGFDRGDLESGHLSIWLPECMRWNYVEPEAKHFLLCRDEVFFWNDLEPGGRHYRIEPEAEPGLDLLMVPIDRLRERYVADSAQQDDGSWIISLSTPPDRPTPFAAKLHLDAETDRLLRLEYTDGEGNLTRFEITGYQELEHTALFQPPKDIEWIEE